MINEEFKKRVELVDWRSVLKSGQLLSIGI